MPKHTLFLMGDRVTIKFCDPDKEGALAYLQEAGASYVVEGCTDIFEGARVIQTPHLSPRLQFFLESYKQKGIIIREDPTLN